MFKKKNFELFFNTIQETNIQPKHYYTNYRKIIKNFEKFRNVLNQLGIVTKAEFNFKLKKIIKQDSSSIEIIPLFSAIRPDKLIVINSESNKVVKKFNHQTITILEAFKFLEEVGFYDIFEKFHKLDIVSYYLGIEVGLDSNARKNRSGKQMENLVDSYLKQFQTKNKGIYIAQVPSNKISLMFGFDNLGIMNLDSIITKVKRKFDFIIKTKTTIYFVETNFFNSSGSKLDVLEQYLLLQTDIRKLQSKNFNLKFLLITDGLGWKSHKTTLAKHYSKIELIMNIDDLKNGALLLLD